MSVCFRCPVHDVQFQFLLYILDQKCRPIPGLAWPIEMCIKISHENYFFPFCCMPETKFTSSSSKACGATYITPTSVSGMPVLLTLTHRASIPWCLVGPWFACPTLCTFFCQYTFPLCLTSPPFPIPTSYGHGYPTLTIHKPLFSYSHNPNILTPCQVIYFLQFAF